MLSANFFGAGRASGSGLIFDLQKARLVLHRCHTSQFGPFGKDEKVVLSRWTRDHSFLCSSVCSNPVCLWWLRNNFLLFLLLLRVRRITSRPISIGRPPTYLLWLVCWWRCCGWCLFDLIKAFLKDSVCFSWLPIEDVRVGPCIKNGTCREGSQ